jgi:hypothetical protein
LASLLVLTSASLLAQRAAWRAARSKASGQ